MYSLLVRFIKAVFNKLEFTSIVYGGMGTTLRSGVSAVVAGTIIVLLIVLGVVPLIMLYINTLQETYRAYTMGSAISSLKELEDVTANLSNGILTIENIGSIPTDISYIVLKDSSGLCSLVVKAYDLAQNYTIEESNITLNPITEVVRIEPKGYIKLNISLLNLQGGSEVCNVVTSRGKVVEVKRIVELAERAVAVLATPLTFELATLANRTDVIVNEAEVQPAIPKEDSTEAGIGMIRTSSTNPNEITALIRVLEVKSETGSIISIRGSPTYNISYNNIFIGYDPVWSKSKIGPPQYNIMITGYESLTLIIGKGEGILDNTYTDNLIRDRYRIVEEEDYYEVHLEDIPYRIKIIGYRPQEHLVLYHDVYYNGSLVKLVDEEALGYWWLYSNQYVCTSFISFSWECINVAQGYIELNGTAREVIIYLDASDVGLDVVEGSYDPYLFSADVDGNGYAELVFITEDESCSGANLGNVFYGRVNDVGHLDYSSIDPYSWAEDWSLKPFLINLTGYTVNGKEIAFVQVAIRAYFHDNLFDNPELIGGLGLPLSEEVKDKSRVLFGVYLVDALTKKVVSSREWCFDELDGTENTFPPSKNFIVLTANLPVPTNGTYYISIGFQDPYPYTDDGYDDGDFIIALEVIGITYYARP